MKAKGETMEKMNVYANDLVRLLVKDGASFSEDHLKVALENVVRAMVDMTNNHLNLEHDTNEVLQATLCKMKIAHNSLHSQLNEQRLEKTSSTIPPIQSKETNKKIAIH